MTSAQTRSRGIVNSNMSRNGDIDFKFTEFIPEPPDSLKPVGKQRWYQVADILVRRKTWSLDWLPALEHMCATWDVIARLDAEIRRLPTIICYNSTGTPRVHPLIGERAKLDTFLQNQLNCFGLTPVTAKAVYKAAGPANEKPNTGRNRKLTIFQEEEKE